MSNNNLQFITLPIVKQRFGFTDTQDDMKLLSIIQSCNLEIRKRIITAVDSLDSIEGSDFFQSGSDAALVFCESEKLRQINKQYDEAAKVMTQFESMMESYIILLKAQAPTRTSRVIASRDTDPEDDYFAERHTV